MSQSHQPLGARVYKLTKFEGENLINETTESDVEVDNKFVSVKKVGMIYFGNIKDTWEKHQEDHQGKRNVLQGGLSVDTVPISITYPKPINMRQSTYKQLIAYELDQLELFMMHSSIKGEDTNKIFYFLSEDVEKLVHEGEQEKDINVEKEVHEGEEGKDITDPGLKNFKHLLTTVETRLNRIFQKKEENKKPEEEELGNKHLEIPEEEIENGKNFKKVNDFIHDYNLVGIEGLDKRVKNRLKNVIIRAKPSNDPDELQRIMLRSLRIEKNQSRHSESTLSVLQELYKKVKNHVSNENYESKKNIKSYLRDKTESWASKLLDYVERRDRSFNAWWNILRTDDAYHSTNLKKAGTLAHDLLHIKSKRDIEKINKEIIIFLQDIEKQNKSNGNKNSELTSILISIQRGLFTSKLLYSLPLEDHTIDDLIEKLPHIKNTYCPVITSHTESASKKNMDVAMSEEARQGYLEYLNKIKNKLMNGTSLDELANYFYIGKRLNYQLRLFATDNNEDFQISKILDMGVDDFIDCLYKTTGPDNETQSRLSGWEKIGWIDDEQDLLSHTARIIKGVKVDTTVSLSPKIMDALIPGKKGPSKLDILGINGLRINPDDRTLDFPYIFKKPETFDYSNVKIEMIGALNEGLLKISGLNTNWVIDNILSKKIEKILADQENTSLQIKEKISNVLTNAFRNVKDDKNKDDENTEIIKGAINTVLKNYSNDFFKKNFEYGSYKKMLELRIMPGLIALNIAHPEGFIFTLPAIDCGSNAGYFSDLIKPKFERAFKELIKEHQAELNHLKAIVYTDSDNTADTVEPLGVGLKIPFIATQRQIGTAPQLDKNIFKNLGLKKENLAYLLDNKRCSVVATIKTDPLSQLKIGDTVQSQVDAVSSVSILPHKTNVLHKKDLRLDNPTLKLMQNIFMYPKEATERQKIERLAAFSTALYYSKNQEDIKLGQSLQNEYFTAEIAEQCVGSPRYQVQYFLVRLLEVETKNTEEKKNLIKELSDLLDSPISCNDSALISRFQLIADKTIAQLKAKEKSHLVKHQLRSFIEKGKKAITNRHIEMVAFSMREPSFALTNFFEKKKQLTSIDVIENNKFNTKAENIKNSDNYLSLAQAVNYLELNQNDISSWNDFSEKVPEIIFNFVLQCLYFMKPGTTKTDLMNLNLSATTLAILFKLKDLLPIEIEGDPVKEKLNQIYDLVYQSQNFKNKSLELYHSIKEIDEIILKTNQLQTEYKINLIPDIKKEARSYFIKELNKLLSEKDNYRNIETIFLGRESVKYSSFNVKIMSSQEFEAVNQDTLKIPTLVYDPNTNSFQLWGYREDPETKMLKWKLRPIQVPEEYDYNVLLTKKEFTIREEDMLYQALTAAHNPNTDLKEKDLAQISELLNFSMKNLPKSDLHFYFGPGSQYKIYDCQRLSATLRTAGFSEDEINEMTVYQALVYDAVIFSIIGNLNVGKGQQPDIVINLARTYLEVEGPKAFSAESDQQLRYKLILEDRILFEKELTRLAKPIIETDLKKTNNINKNIEESPTWRFDPFS